MDSNKSNNLNKLFWEVIEEELMDNTDEELLLSMLEKERQSRNSSRRKRRSVIDRNREEGHIRLFNNYFSENPVYTDAQFRRRFRMHRHLFLRIVETLRNYDEYFQMRVDATDEYVRIGESTAIECLERFVRGVNEVFGAEYLRRPNSNDVEHLLQMRESCGFPDMLGSIYCMHWEWKNCPVAWKGQFCRGDHGKPTIMLEAVASQDLWIWHAFFGIAGSNNDINVLNQSNVFNDILEGRAATVQYTINGNPYNMGYYLADGIYPEWATFVKTISMPQGEERKLFAQHQESARKDVERAFGVLQSRFAIVRGPARAWHMETLKHTIYACIILHNMIVEDERHTYGGDFDYCYDNAGNNNSTTETFSGPHPNLATRLQRRATLHEKQVHRQLQGDLVEHIWECFGHEDDEN
ncbi:uncharacterized protein LOC131645627 [Vicia villosa]|uniref:uncharacterized protein LOC131645627 n=1 Tax=Vicia villosa TaxID=3911 RepID=UPI00273A7E37|nr:uncharacterized protein LOC131645627 [Vicia villosa]